MYVHLCLCTCVFFCVLVFHIHTYVLRMVIQCSVDALAFSFSIKHVAVNTHMRMRAMYTSVRTYIATYCNYRMSANCSNN